METYDDQKYFDQKSFFLSLFQMAWNTASVTSEGSDAFVNAMEDFLADRKDD